MHDFKEPIKKCNCRVVFILLTCGGLQCKIWISIEKGQEDLCKKYEINMKRIKNNTVVNFKNLHSNPDQ